ncbi:MAG: hypothetical protein H0X47_14230 [Nitrospirales bacterium]|nr:hypothetical protein [Nitrospirales bacterium]
MINTICYGTNCSKHTRTDFTFESYRSVTRSDQYGDTGSSADDRTVTHTFLPNTSAWILRLHATETMYEGLGTDVAARTGYFTNGTTSCRTPSSNQQPI